MTDYCIALAPEEKASRVIEKLVDHALPIPNTEDPAHFDSPQALLSDKFLFHLMHPSDSSSMTLHHHYRQWSTDLKIKLLNHYDDILEMEVLTLIEVYVQQGKYMHLDDLNKKIRHHALIPVLSSPVLKERALFHLASSVELFHHWELIRLNTCFQDILRSRLYERCHAIILYHSDCISACARELFDVMRSYIFSGSIEGISTRKYHVWTFTLSLNRYIWQCTHTLMVWCNGNDPWVSPVS
ncbi:hypothetical protein BDB01DRAFT_713473 [Pilobolus umbonatus]|nr:hypothetical protein BDB01DRAFT_713473 [Pilobolus umbonatus]